MILCLCGIFYTLSHTRSQDVINTGSQGSGISDNESPSFNLEKARECLKLCSLSYSPSDLEKKLIKLGSDSVSHFCRDQDGSFGSGIAFSVGSRSDNENTLLTVVFRGTNKGEWYSNFSVGNSCDHAGFSAACDYALYEIDTLVQNMCLNKKNTDILITGHSRGGAVANLCAKRLLDSDDYSSVFAYTFAAPNTTISENTDNDIYKNIINIVNPEDFIPYLPLEIWDYKKYGITIELPDAESIDYDNLYTEMQKRYRKLTKKVHNGYENRDKDVKQFISLLGSLSPTVDDYYNRTMYVPPYEITLYEYMQKVSEILSNDQALLDGMFLLSSGCINDFSRMTGFLMQGITIEDAAENHDITSSAIYCGHAYETYMAWLDVLDEEYFLNRIAK